MGTGRFVLAMPREGSKILNCATPATTARRRAQQSPSLALPGCTWPDLNVHVHIERVQNAFDTLLAKLRIPRIVITPSTPS
jgi:hypothetical protein